MNKYTHKKYYKTRHNARQRTVENHDFNDTCFKEEELEETGVDSPVLLTPVVVEIAPVGFLNPVGLLPPLEVDIPGGEEWDPVLAYTGETNADWC